MPITPTYPGIYIQELPSNSHTITAAPTSIAVFIGYTHPFKTPPANFGVPVQVFSFGDYEAQFGGFFLSKYVEFGNLARAVNDFFLNGGAQAYVVSTNGSNNTSTLQYTLSDGSDQTPAGTPLGPVTPANTIFSGISFTALEPTESPDTKMIISISNVTPPIGDTATADITITYSSRSETFRKVAISKTDPSVLNNRINGISTLVTVAPPSGSNNYSGSFTAGTTDLTTVKQLPAKTVGVFNASDFTPVFAADSLLDKLPIFNLMAIPGIVNNSVLSEALAFCERKLAFFIMDPPKADVADGSNPDYIGKFIDQSGDKQSNIAPLSQNGALYFPYLQSSDPLTGNSISSPPSGFVAGIYARTDTNRGVWKAPAGLETSLLDTTGVVATGRMTDSRQGDLNNKGVNCLRTFSTGTVVFGARTLVSSNPAFQQWKYVSVRRMALFIEQTLLENLKWVIFEPNDAPLWTSIRASIEGFMMTLFNQGAFQGGTPSQAFKVICDSTTTTQTDIDNATVNIIVAFAPLKPAEFVIIKIAQLAGQAQQ